MDTVLVCHACGRQFRGTYDPTTAATEEECRAGYDNFVAMFIAEIDAEHVCGDDDA